MIINSRPKTAPATQQPVLTSAFQIGDIVCFAPAATMPRPGGTYVSWIGLSALVVGVKFKAGKVLYDLALPDDPDGTFYLTNPIQNVDSIYIEHSIPATPGQHLLQP